ncbi:MAG: HPr family phosphocarrier protein [Collinsella sp.]|nr:HPr family phosphocarrier protein [Collinsella sp.]
MVEFTKTIKDPLGLHARPVALLYDIIAKHRSDVSVSIGDRIPTVAMSWASWLSTASAARTSSFAFRA